LIIITCINRFLPTTSLYGNRFHKNMFLKHLWNH
jgi:hypothetical protein